MLLRKYFQVFTSFFEKRALFVILAIGALLRISAIGWGLPYMLHPDEYQLVNTYLSMVKAHSLNPHFYTYPTLPIYINGFFYTVYYLILRIAGYFHSAADIAFPQIIIMGTGIIADPNIYYIGRLVSIAFGLGTIYLVYRCAREISKNPWVAILAAGFTAVSNANVLQSRLILSNIFVAFFAICTIWLSLRFYKTGQIRYCLLAGFAVGLTAGAKYNGAVVAAAVAAAYFLRTGWQGWKKPWIYLAALLSAVGFLATNMYTVLDFKNFYPQFIAARDAYVFGWPGAADTSIIWYLTYLFQYEGMMAAAAFGALIWAVWKRQPYLMIVGIFPLIYLGILSLMKYYNEHTLLHLLPGLHVIGAYFLVLIIQKGLARFSNQKPLARAAAALLVFVAIAQPLWRSVTTSYDYIKVDSRTTARIWIEKNIPAGSKIGLEAYSPYVDPQKYNVVGVVGFLPRELKWYQENHFQYLVFSGGMYYRYFYNPGHYQAEIEIYKTLFNSLEPVKIFNDGGYEVRIYKVKNP